MFLDRRTCAVALSLAVGALLASAASANFLNWNVGNGSFNSASSWTRNPADTNPPDADGIPDADDSVLFNRGGGVTYSVTFPGHLVLDPPANYFSASTAIGSNNVSFINSSNPIFTSSTYTTSGITISGSPINPAILTTALGQLSTTTASIGAFSGTAATLNVDAGTFSVTGAGVEGLLVGGDGNGTLNVNPGAHVTVTGADTSMVIGKTAGVTGTANVSGAGATWSNMNNSAGANISVGGSGAGIFNITAGARVNVDQGYIAHNSGSTGSATVNGAGSTWTNRSQLIVGTMGNGSLTISGGGQVLDGMSIVGANPNSSGTVTVTGAGSKWTQTNDLRLGSNSSSNGNTGPGTMLITVGGEVATGGDGFVGVVGNGTVAINGIGSKWTVAGRMDVDDTGSVNVTGGGQITSGTAIVDGMAIVSGIGSTLNTTDYISIGNVFTLNGTGFSTFNLLGGAHANNRVAVIGDSRGYGQVVIDGVGTAWSTSDQLFVGVEGKGEMFIGGSAQVTSAGAVLGVSPQSLGHIGVGGAGSKWTNSGDAIVGGAGDGTLTVSNSGVAKVDGQLSVGLHGTVEGNSQVVGELRNGGTVAPGLATGLMPSDALGTLSLSGNFTQIAAGTLDIQLASLASFDKLAIDGHATLAGTLHASLFNGFAPAVGSTFQVLTATGGISGTFALDFPTFGTINGPRWILVYSSNDVVLKFVNLPTGDYNHNGIVDAADYTIWQDTLGQTGLSPAADGDGDHVVDQDDFNVWKSNFGVSIGSGAGGVATNLAPEPASVALALFAIAVFLGCWFYRQRSAEIRAFLRLSFLAARTLSSSRN